MFHEKLFQQMIKMLVRSVPSQTVCSVRVKLLQKEQHDNVNNVATAPTRLTSDARKGCWYGPIRRLGNASAVLFQGNSVVRSVGLSVVLWCGFDSGAPRKG